MPKIKKSPKTEETKAEVIMQKEIKTEKKPKTEAKKIKYIFSVGRRKRSVALVKLYAGKGKSVVNGKPIEEYFLGRTAAILYRRPLALLRAEENYYCTSSIKGGGKAGQLEAFIHALSRALVQADKQNRKILKENLLLRRNPKEKERRKPGLAGKARKRKQSPKR